MVIPRFCARRSPGQPAAVVCSATLIALLSGCGDRSQMEGTAPPDASTASTPTSTTTKMMGATAESQTTAASVAQQTQSEPGQQVQPEQVQPIARNVTPADIAALALAFSPERAVFAANSDAAQARILSAQAWANPEVAFSAGQASPRGGGDAITIGSVDIEQRFEMPGKRSSRIAAARADSLTTAHDIALAALDLEYEVRLACLALAEAEAMGDLSAIMLETANETADIVAKQVAAGEATNDALARVRLDQISAEVAHQRAVQTIAAERSRLRLWSGPNLPDNFILQNTLPNAVPDLSRDAALTASMQHPQLERAQSALTASAAQLDHEQRAWQPDVTVGAFSERDADTDNLGVTVGLELPIWNRNQGGVALAQAQHRQAAARSRADRLMITREVDIAWQRYEASRLALAAIQSYGTQAAASMLASRQRALAAGEASLLDVSDARRAVHDVTLTILAARHDAAEAALTLGRALGSFSAIDTLSSGAQP